jgi:hypothetical protein
VRSRENFLRHGELMMTAASLGGAPHGRGAALGAVTALRRAVGVSQHHDAITGTEKNLVVADYMSELSKATAAVNNATSAVAGQLLQKGAAPAAMTADAGVMSLIGTSLPCGGRPAGGKPVSLRCVSWRQTADCDPTGSHREPRNDKPCADQIPPGASGYCECAGGVKRGLVGCTGHASFTCDDVCLVANTAHCFGLPTPPESFNTSAVVLHNTLGWDVVHTARVVVNRSDLVVLDEDGALVPSQLNPLPAFAPEAHQATGPHYFPEMATAPAGFQAPTYLAGYALYFAATLPPASLSTYFITIDPTRAVQGKKQDFSAVGGVLENTVVRAEFDVSSGLLKAVSNKHSGANASVKQQLWQYRSGDKDGAYIFRPAMKRQTQNAAVAAAAATAPAALAAPCNLTDTWTYHPKDSPSGDRDSYSIVEAADASGKFTVSVLHSGSAKPGWRQAQGTDTDSRITIHFDSGVDDTGAVDSCDHIIWKDATFWTRQGAEPLPPPGPPRPGGCANSLQQLCQVGVLVDVKVI